MRVKILYTILFVALTFFLSGCSATYEIVGRVIQLPELKSSTGFLAEVTEQSLPQGGTPVVGAKVRMITHLDEQDKPVENTVWQDSFLTIENGFFRVIASGKPSKELKVGIEVSKDGYKTLYETRVLQSNSEAKVFLVVLAPNGAG
jgi:predicted small secreted protein